jgi:hypothetical protein
VPNRDSRELGEAWPFGRRVHPFAHLTPGGCEYFAENAEGVVAFFTKWGLGRSALHRLHEAARVLRRVASSGSYGATDVELTEAATAMTLAMDFYAIASTLDPTRIDGIVDELAPALAGALISRTRDRTARATQSQFWITMLFVRAGVAPAILGASFGRRPDFAVTIDSLPFAVEVKRPESWKSAPDGMDAAADQIRHSGMPGVIVLDLSDCIEADKYIVGAIDSPIPAHELLRSDYDLGVRRIVRRAKTYCRSDKYDHVAALVTLARICAWSRQDMSQPRWTVFGEVEVLERAYRGLIVGTTSRLRDALLRGLSDVALSPVNKLPSP